MHFLYLAPEETETKNCVSLVGDDKTALGFSSEKERSLDVATEECAKIDPSSQLFNSNQKFQTWNCSKAYRFQILFHQVKYTQLMQAFYNPLHPHLKY